LVVPIREAELMIRQVSVHKAQPLRPDKPTQAMAIEIYASIPDNFSTDQLNQMYELDAAKICAALWATLPGGTLDRLLPAMLLRAASSLVIPKGEWTGGKAQRIRNREQGTRAGAARGPQPPANRQGT
jgi:hypothetical protein